MKTVEDFMEETYEITEGFLRFHIKMLNGLKEVCIRNNKLEKAEGVQDCIDLIESSIDDGKYVLSKIKEEVNDFEIINQIPELKRGN